jgi:hypothetical protein
MSRRHPNVYPILKNCDMMRHGRGPEAMDTNPEALRQYTARDRLRDGRVLRVRAVPPEDELVGRGSSPP